MGGRGSPPVIRVVVVDDSTAIRRVVCAVLRSDPQITVVGQAEDGMQALEVVARERPDVVTLDVEMPRMDGLATLRRLRTDNPRLPVVMFSSLTEQGAATTVTALTSGASDYVQKPAGGGAVTASMAAVREQLLPKVRALGVRREVAVLAGAVSASVPADVQGGGAGAKAARRQPEVVVVGCSTGGPDALSLLLRDLPADLGVPVLVVQHMPAVFTTLLAERLGRVCPLPVREAVDGEELSAGQVTLAPGDFHLRVSRRAGHARLHLDQEPPVHFCRPAVDPTLESVAAAYGPRALAVVLTGMGSDGAAGARAVAAAGGSVLAQDEDSSVVWGMPGAVVAAGAADEVLPLASMAARIGQLVRRRAG
ncbi:chemotaxis-specific protein-glutamate methyltransferase CheB [Nocardioidaceae bacterium]|nr:chemotaxis-specific protein-glutamate methyltransferase CheB [Nocardioidaceae bacterium]